MQGVFHYKINYGIVMNEIKEHIEIGKIINTRGIRGELKIEPWSDSPAALLGVKRFYFENGESAAVHSLRVLGGRFLLAFADGVNTPEEARKLMGKTVLADRNEIKKAPDAVFICDLIGLPVTDAENGTVYGTLSDVIEGVAQRLYCVKTQKGTVLIPDVPEFIKRTDAEKGVFIKPIVGFFDEGEEV